MSVEEAILLFATASRPGLSRYAQSYIQGYRGCVYAGTAVADTI